MRDGLASTSQNKVVWFALTAIFLLALLIQQSVSNKLTLLFITGTALGIVLYHSVFGFTSAFRVLLADGRSAGFRAQMIMLGSACLLFFPALANGTLFGQPIEGNVSPVSVSVVIGSFIFGIGMQLGGGCASGTLFTAGGGSVRMLVTLLFFIVGSVFGVMHQAWWKALPSLEPISLVATFGWLPALALNLSVFAIAYFTVASIERRRHGKVETISQIEKASWLRGPWPLVAGALALALLNFTTLYLSGKPWGITSAFGLWGGMALQSVGLSVETWPGFAAPAMQKSLNSNLLSDITSVMGRLNLTDVRNRLSPTGGWR